MAGEKTVAPTNGMQNILSLLQTIAGTETKTTSTANIGPLQSVMDQIAASQGTQGQQLLESIFSQAAGAVPGIMGNTFNASGSRAPNNVMAGTLQKLMADVTKQAQAQIVQQQQNAQQMQLNAASQIANATRGQRQVQKSGASKVVTDLGKVLSINKAVKGLTGKDMIQSGVDGVKSIFAPSPAAAFTASGYNGLSIAPGLPLFGGTSTSNPGFGDALSSLLGGSSPMSGEAASLPTVVAPAETSPLFASSIEGSDLPANLSVLSSLDSATGGVDGLSVTFGDPADLKAVSDMYAARAGYGFPVPADSASALSTGEAASSASSSTNYGSYLKAAELALDDNKRKGLFSFNDGNWVDDISDVSDAVSIFFPPAAAARSMLGAADAYGNSLNDFVNDPGQWAENVASGEDEVVVGSLLNTTIGSIPGVGNALSNAVEEVGDFFGDVFGW